MSDDRMKRDMQYIRALEAERNEKSTAVKELENKIASLRKNPANKIANDLYIYQYNKEIDVLKEKIAQIEKQISSAKTSFGEEDFYDEEAEEPFSSIEVEKIRETKPVSPVVKTENKEQVVSVKKSGIKEFFSAFSAGKVVFLAIICLISSVLCYQLDKTDLISYVGKYNRLINLPVICFMAIVVFCVTAYFAFKGVSKKPFGVISDYFCVYAFYLSLNLFVAFAFNRTKFKLIIFVALLVYALFYFIVRVRVYGVNLEESVRKKSSFIRYYFDLFKKYNMLMLAVVFIILSAIGYVFGFTWVTRSLWNGKITKGMVIIDSVIFVLAFIYYLGFAFFRLNEKDLKIIDLTALLIQLFAIGICIFSVLAKRAPYTVVLISTAVATLCSIVITACRIFGYKK